MMRIGLLIFFGLSIAACGQFKSAEMLNLKMSSGFPLASPYGTCDRKDLPAYNICTEAVGSDYADPGYLTILQSSCESTGGIYSTNNCDRTTSLGSCLIAHGQSNETHVTYYSSQYTADTAQSECELTAGGIYYPKM